MNQEKNLPIGRENFQDIIEKKLYYVDKTGVIGDLLNNQNYVALFPRPRRFGKSLFLSMLENFFNIEKKEQNKNLFNGLKISQSPYYQELSTRPVIKISFKDLKKDAFENIYNSYQEMIRELYSNKQYLLEKLTEHDKNMFQKFLRIEANRDEYQKAIQLLSGFLYQYYGKKVIILIDEYDVPIQQGYLNGFYDEVVSFIREVFSSALKGNDYVEMAIMTGVLRVSKESLFSDLNNVKVYGIVEKEYNEYFGFTEEETKELLKYYDLELTDDVKNMYDGYNFHGLSIYNPWSIINYASDKTLISYWVNTSGNELLIDLIRKTDDDIKIVFERLLQGESVEFIYDGKVTFLDYNRIHSLNTIINLLFISGYLTLSREEKTNFFGKNSFKAVIPNEEVKELFITILTEELIDHPGITLVMLRAFSEGLLENNSEKIEDSLNKILPSVSFMDQTESFYHGYVLGLFSMFLYNQYIIKSNREAGMGRFDLMIEATDRSLGILIEFKITDGDMEKSANDALKQIHKKEYYQELLLDKVDKIYSYAIIFQGKKCIVQSENI